MLEVAHSRYTLIQTREWVDDLVQRVIGPVSRIQHHLERAGLFVLRGLREAGFTVSPKTTLVTTDRSLSTRLMQKYRVSGFPVHSAMSAADLGIDRGFAARRRIPKHTRRWKGALFRARKICRLARNLTSSRTTRMLAVTGMLPSATYSSKLLGMATSQLDRLRTATVSALMPRKAGRCRTTTLAIAMGDSEPGISIGVELIRSWNILHQRISHIPRTRRWRRVGGHLAAVITTLLDAGWKPHTATCWEDPDGNEWSVNENEEIVDFSPILSAVAASLSSSLWRHASEHCAELQAFLCFLQRTKGAATYICDAMAVFKGFRRLRLGRRCVSNTNQDLWSSIGEAAKQRDIEVHWVASHEESKIDHVDATMAWFIGLNTLADAVAETAAEFCEFPETVPALTSSRQAMPRLCLGLARNHHGDTSCSVGFWDDQLRT